MSQALQNDPYAKYGGNVADDSDIEQPIASVRVGDAGPSNVPGSYVSGFDSKGRPSLSSGKPPEQPAGDPYSKYGGSVAGDDPYSKYGGNVAAPKSIPKSLPPMTRQQADDYLQSLAAGGTKPYQPPHQPSFTNTALVDPESRVFGEPIKSAIHPDTRGGRNLVPVQDVAATRQQMQYDANNPDVAARIQRDQQMDTGLPLAQRLAARQGLQARTRTEFGQAVSNVNDQYLNYVGNKGADTGQAFAQFMARNFQTENPQATPGEIGVARSVGKNVVRTLADPTNAAVTLASGGVGGPAGRVVLSSLFAAGAAKNSYDTAGQLGSIWDRQDIPSQQKAEMASDLLLNTAVAGMTGAHAMSVPFMRGDEPFLSSIPAEDRAAVAQKFNSAISKTGGVLLKGISNAGSAFNKLPMMPAEGFPPTPRETMIQSVVDAAPKVGVQLNSADNAIQAIRQARADTLAHHENLAGGNLADISPDQAENMNAHLDLLNTLEDHIAAGRDAAIENASKAQPTRGQAAMDFIKGAGKATALYGLSTAAESLIPGLAGNPTIPIALEVAGLSKFGGPQIVRGIKGMIGKRPMTPAQHDALVEQMFSGHQSEIQPSITGANYPAGTDPFFRPPQPVTDTTVQHTSNIAAPERTAGEARTFPDVPSRMMPFASSSTANLNPVLTQILETARQAAPGTVTTFDPGAFTSVPQGVTPELPARQLPLGQATPQPASTASLMQRLSADPKLAAIAQEIQRKAPPANAAVDVKAAQTMNPDYLVRHGSALDQAKAEWQAQNPGQPVPVWNSDIMRRAGEIDAKMRQGASAPATPQAGDIFPNDQAMEDRLNQQEQNSPVLQRVKDLAKERIKQGDLPPGIRPSDSDLSHMERQVKSAIYEANAQGIDTPAWQDIADQWMRRTNVSPKPFQAGKPLKTRPVPLEGSDLLAGLMDMKAKADAAKAAAQAKQTIAQSLAPLAEAKLIDPTSPVAAQLSALRNELVRTTDPAQRTNIQQAIDHYTAIAQGVPFQPPSQAVVENLPASQPREIEPGTYNRETKVTTPAGNQGPTVMFPVSRISVKPDVMQFRTDADPVTGEQAGRNIGGVKFDQELAGPVRLWRDPQTGEVLLGDGHHRLALAKRSGVENIESRFMDVPTVEAARARAAFSNIAEGNASLFDAAKFLRDSGITPEQLAQKNISLSSGIAQKALSLSKLDAPIFDKVRTGELSENQGAIIGEATNDPAIQESVIKEMKSREKYGRSITDANVTELAKLAKLAGTKTEMTMDLFGQQAQVTGLLGEVADAISDTRKTLVSRSNTFGAVAKEGRAKTLGSVEGQNIVPGENARISQQADQLNELLDKVSMSPGPVHDIYMSAAREMVGRPAKEVREIKTHATQDVIDELVKMLPAGSQLPTGGLNAPAK